VEPIKCSNHKFGQKLPLTDLRIKVEVQRALVPRRVAKLQKEFDPCQVGELLVHAEGDGTYSVIDGNHRREVMISLGIAKWECEAFWGLSEEDQGKLFLGRNDRAGIASADKHRVLKTTGNEGVEIVFNAARSAGLVFIGNPGETLTYTDLGAAEAIMTEASRGGLSPTAHLAEMFQLYTAAFGKVELCDSYVLRGIHKVVLRSDTLDRAELVQVLASRPLQVILADMKSYMQDEHENGNRINRVSAAHDVLAGMLSLAGPRRRRRGVS
jgi:hypothetical protein